MMKLRFLIPLFIVFYSAESLSEEVYKGIDENGVVQCSDRRSEGKSSVVNLETRKTIHLKGVSA
jgi:hypothetical protein